LKFAYKSIRGICIKSTNQQAKSMRKQLIFFAQLIIRYETQGRG